MPVLSLPVINSTLTIILLKKKKMYFFTEQTPSADEYCVMGLKALEKKFKSGP